MKDKFSQYLPPDYEQLFERGLVVYDANILLNLYRVSENTSERLLSVIEKLKDRSWISYQAADEFFRNRPEVVYKAQVAVRKALEACRKAFDEELSRHIKSDFKANSDFVQDINEALEGFIERLKRVEDFSLSATLRDDEILDRLLVVFAGRTGDEPSPTWVEEATKTAQERCEKGIPPGFKDYNKKDAKPPNVQFGDYFVWKQTIERVKSDEHKDTLLFVTDDRKDDWFQILHGKTLGPLPALIKELSDAGITGWILSSDQFLHHAAAFLHQAPDEEAEKELRQIQFVGPNAEANQRRHSEIVAAFNALSEDEKAQRLAEINDGIYPTFSLPVDVISSLRGGDISTGLEKMRIPIASLIAIQEAAQFEEIRRLFNNQEIKDALAGLKALQANELTLLQAIGRPLSEAVRLGEEQTSGPKLE